MSAEPHPVPRLFTNTAIEDLNRDKLHAHLEADPDWQFVETANETYLWKGDLVHGRFLLYQHRVERHHTIAVPAPGSGPTNPAWREQALCTRHGSGVFQLAALHRR
ncbi:hypothetical protein AB0392_03005 [Nonomuraea angiospora]|uniref:hypothetical protein n=1 Tax=Nonomuraea angiospora TaxID=46172 RepID=UPI00344E1507